MSERGKQQLVHDGEVFNLNRDNKLNNKSSWRCRKRPCKASVATIANELNSKSGKLRYETIPCKEEVKKK